eukprot:11720690-Alexandrium_andersonii.AAC.2
MTGMPRSSGEKTAEMTPQGSPSAESPGIGAASGQRGISRAFVFTMASSKQGGKPSTHSWHTRSGLKYLMLKSHVQRTSVDSLRKVSKLPMDENATHVDPLPSSQRRLLRSGSARGVNGQSRPWTRQGADAAKWILPNSSMSSVK